MDRNEFGVRARLCQTRLYKIALAILSQPYDAQDAVQDALIRAWENLPRLKNDAYFETWLTRILINRSREILRERAAHPSQEFSENMIGETQAAPDPDLRRALEALDTRYRLPLVMRCVLDMPIAEVAKALSVPYGVAKWRIHQAKKLAQKYLCEGGRKQ
ncbi:MAG: sigma-70 family RNA polymerase sigma factor [Clostridia bacterium]|nr:sigma-70 family RNA polymerase sigma factor [Clostridia bacterium]